jgi:protein-tyrosine phosphatase
VVSALSPEEVDELDLGREKELAEAGGIKFTVFPIADRGVPASAKAAAELIHELEGYLATGKNVAIHCRQGVGRSALLAASLLAFANVDLEDAFDKIREARGCPVPDTPEQRNWTAQFVPDWLTPARR